jgi:hypothetical protein
MTALPLYPILCLHCQDRRHTACAEPRCQCSCRRHPAFAGRAGRDWRRAVAGALIVAVAVLLARGWLA